MADKYVEVIVDDTEPAAQPQSRDDAIVEQQARVYIEIKETQAKLKEEKELLAYGPYEHGRNVMQLEQRLVRLAKQYQELGASKSANSRDGYNWSSGQVFSGR
jgi:hypothetical protein